MVICYLLLHFNQLQALPAYERKVFIESDTNSCQRYGKKGWKVLNKDGKQITITNGVTKINGYIFTY